MKKIVICGGHLTPALALIDELKSKKDLKIIFFGRKYATEGSKNLSAEYQVISKLNLKFYSITAGRLQRKFTKFTIPALFKVPIGFGQSLLFLLLTRPNLIVSFGGYLSLPVVFAGWLLGIKSITHEQSIILGLANKINSLFVEKMYLSWPETVKFLNTESYQVIGNLTRRAVFKNESGTLKIQKFLRSTKKLILVIGGNQGSHYINGLIFDLLPKLNNYQLIHQVGTANYKGDLDKAKATSKKNYLSLEYIDQENIGTIFSRADVVISRSGANTIWDLAICAKPAILIPLPIAASGEQEKNAQILQKSGSGIVVNQKDLNANKLNEKIDYLFKNLAKYQKNAQNFSQTLPKDAATILKSEIQNLI